MTMNEFIIQNKKDFDSYEFYSNWNGYKVYSIWLKKDEGACVGLPQFALEKDGIVRVATHDEIQSIFFNN